MLGPPFSKPSPLPERETKCPLRLARSDEFAFLTAGSKQTNRVPGTLVVKYIDLEALDFRP